MALAASGVRRSGLASGSQSPSDMGRTPVPTMPHRWFLDIYDHGSYISLKARAVKNYLCGLSAAAALASSGSSYRIAPSIFHRYPSFTLLPDLTAQAHHWLHASSCQTALFVVRKLAHFVGVFLLPFPAGHHLKPAHSLHCIRSSFPGKLIEGWLHPAALHKSSDRAERWQSPVECT